MPCQAEKLFWACDAQLLHYNWAFSCCFPDCSLGMFEDVIGLVNKKEDVRAVIVQYPVPDHLLRVLSAVHESKDIDAVGGREGRYKICAAAEAALRVAAALSPLGAITAVIGAKGRVGSDVVFGLRGVCDVLSIDKGDSLEAINSATTVITAVGQPRLIRPEHIRSGPLSFIDLGIAVSDISFGGIRIDGDVCHSTYPLLRSVTPVPGGIGPLHVATLIERFFSIAPSPTHGHPPPSWKVPTMPRNAL